MNLSHMSTEELRISAEACQRIMHRRPPTAASHRIAARQFNAYRAELARRASSIAQTCSVGEIS